MLFTRNALEYYKNMMQIIIAQNEPLSRRLQLDLYSIKVLLAQRFIRDYPSNRYSSYLMSYILRHLIANMPTLWYQCALDFVSTGQCATAIVWLKRAIKSCHLPSRALMAFMLFDGREGVVCDSKAAFELAKEGARLGCHHCQGMLAQCYIWGCGIRQDSARSLELAHESAKRGSRYGQRVLGVLYEDGEGGIAKDRVKALAFYVLAAEQKLDGALLGLGHMYRKGLGVARDDAEALRLFLLAAAQGHPNALLMVATCHELGRGVPVNKAEAIRWFKRAHAAGVPKFLCRA